MKLINTFLFLLLTSVAVFGQGSVADTSSVSKKIHESAEREPTFPGGGANFFAFIHRSLHYPEVANLVGIKGKVSISFTVGKDGYLKNIHALDTIGARCEEEAVRVVTSSPRWTPGLQNGIPIDVKYTIGIAFSAPKSIINLKELRTSNYAFIFEIKGIIYTIDDTENILGKSFPANWVESALPCANKQQYSFSNKKDIYLIKIKTL